MTAFCHPHIPTGGNLGGFIVSVIRYDIVGPLAGFYAYMRVQLIRMCRGFNAQLKLQHLEFRIADRAAGQKSRGLGLLGCLGNYRCIGIQRRVKRENTLQCACCGVAAETCFDGQVDPTDFRWYTAASNDTDAQQPLQ